MRNSKGSARNGGAAIVQSTCDPEAECVARHVARHGLLRPHAAPARKDLWAHVAAVAKVEHLVMSQGRQPDWPTLLSGAWRFRRIAGQCGSRAGGAVGGSRRLKGTGHCCSPAQAGAQPLGVWLVQAPQNSLARRRRSACYKDKGPALSALQTHATFDVVQWAPFCLCADQLPQDQDVVWTALQSPARLPGWTWYVFCLRWSCQSACPGCLPVFGTLRPKFDPSPGEDSSSFCDPKNIQVLVTVVVFCVCKPADSLSGLLDNCRTACCRCDAELLLLLIILCHSGHLRNASTASQHSISGRIPSSTVSRQQQAGAPAAPGRPAMAEQRQHKQHPHHPKVQPGAIQWARAAALSL